MSCKKIQTRLSAYQDGEIPESKIQAIEAHLALCDHCRQMLRELNRIQEELATLPENEPGQTFSALIMARIGEQRPKRSTLLPAFGYSLVVMIVFIIGLVLSLPSRLSYTTAPREFCLTSVLTQNQKMGLISVQDRTLKILEEHFHEE